MMDTWCLLVLAANELEFAPTPMDFALALGEQEVLLHQ